MIFKNNNLQRKRKHTNKSTKQNSSKSTIYSTAKEQGFSWGDPLLLANIFAP